MRFDTYARSLQFTLVCIWLTACSAVVDFPDKAPATGDEGGTGSKPVGDASVDGRVGGGDGGGGCELGSAGSPCKRCEAGQYCAGGSAKAVACADDEWDTDLSPGTPCRAKLTCEVGEYVSTVGSAVSNRMCSPCPSGQFSAAKNAASCADWKICAIGSFVSAPGSVTADQMCTPCPEGMFSDQVNSGRCVPIGSCPSGTKQTAAGGNGLPATCVPCAAGEYCEGDVAPPVPCAEGTWDHDGNAASQCRAQTDCAFGQFVKAAGTAIKDRECAACPDGQFSSTLNAAMCSAPTECGPGTYMSSQTSSGADRMCAPCATGTFSNSANAPACTPYRTCAAGTFISNPGSTTADRQCSTCAPGKFSANANASACTDWKVCPKGEYIATPGSAAADQVCMTCPDNTYSDTPNAGQCVPRGACPPGKRQTAPGSGSNPPTCADCVAGEYCAGFTAAPVSCSGNSWDHDANPATPCVAKTVCAPGFAVTSDGSATMNRACQICGTGLFSDEINTPMCSPCAPEGYPAQDSASCIAYKEICTSPTHYMVSDRTSTADRKCAKCPTGATATNNAPGMESCLLPDGGVGGAFKYVPTKVGLDAGLGGW